MPETFDNLLSFVDFSSAMAMTVFISKTLWNGMILQSCWLACLQDCSRETRAVKSCCLAVGIFYTSCLYILCLYKKLRVWPAEMYMDVLAWWSLYLLNTCICCSQYASLMICCLVLLWIWSHFVLWYDWFILLASRSYYIRINSFRRVNRWFVCCKKFVGLTASIE